MPGEIRIGPNVRLVLNRAAIGQLLKSAEVQADLVGRANRIAAAAGPGHRVDVSQGRHRVRVSVITATFEAMQAEATSRTLTRALDAGR